MRAGGLVLGLIGGVIGLIAAGLALAVGGLGGAMDVADSGLVVTLGWIALGSSIVGIIGGALATAKPRLAALLMFIAAVCGFIGISLFYVVAGPLLLIGALLAFLGRNSKPRAFQAQPSISPDGRYWWDGAAWHLLPPAPPEPPLS
jgi:hypothetical protein